MPRIIIVSDNRNVLLNEYVNPRVLRDEEQNVALFERVETALAAAYTQATHTGRQRRGSSRRDNARRA